MENDIFIQKLISGTKNKKLKWEARYVNRPYRSNLSYQLEKNKKLLIIGKYNTIEESAYGEEIQVTHCSVSICELNGVVLTEIGEDDLKNGSNLWRLYRLVERQANHVDDIMEQFVEDITDIDF